MKNLRRIIFAFVFVIFASCQNDTSHSTHNHEVELTSEAIHSIPENPNGGKWIADAPTHENAGLLAEVVQKTEALPDPGLSDYLNAGKELQEGINKLVSECRMKGPDHDALHGWLEPLIEMVKDLNSATEDSFAHKKFTQVSDQVKLYERHFQFP